MNKNIRTYEDLLREKEKLEGLYKAQKDLLQLDMKQLRVELQPALKTARLMGKLFSRDKDRSLVGVGAERLVDFLFQSLVLRKAGWITKLVVPLLAKNVTSHVIAEGKQNWLQKLRRWTGKKNYNGQTAPDPNPAAPGKTNTGE